MRLIPIPRSVVVAEPLRPGRVAVAAVMNAAVLKVLRPRWRCPPRSRWRSRRGRNRGAHLQRSVTSAPSSTAVPIPSTACSASACRTARAPAAPPPPSSPRPGVSVPPPSDGAEAGAPAAADPATAGSAAAAAAANAGEQEPLTAGGLGEEARSMATCWRTTAMAVWTVCVKERGWRLGSMALRRGGVLLTESCANEWRAAAADGERTRGWGGGRLGWGCKGVVFQVLLTGTIERFGM